MGGRDLETYYCKQREDTRRRRFWLRTTATVLGRGIRRRTDCVAEVVESVEVKTSVGEE